MSKRRKRKGMSVEEYAAASGVSRQTIWRDGKLGALVKYADGSINKEASDRLRDTHIRGKVDSLQRRVDAASTQEPEGFSLADLEPEVPEPGDDVALPAAVTTRADATGAAAYLAARLRSETIKADRAQLKLDEERGVLIPLATLRAAWFERGRALRDRMRAIPARVVGLILAAESEREIVQLLQREVDDAILSLTDPERPPLASDAREVEDEGLTAPPRAPDDEEDEEA